MANINQNRWDQLVRRVAGLIGPGSKVNNTIGDLFPMLDVENLPAELYRLGGTRLCFGGGQLAASAGVAPRAMVFNPAGSGMLVTVTRVDVSSNVTLQLRWGVTNADLGAASGSERFRDTREFTPDLPTAEVHAVASVTLAGATSRSFVLSNTNFTLEPRNAIAVLAPGTGFEIGVQGINRLLNFSFYWRERTAEQSELNF